MKRIFQTIFLVMLAIFTILFLSFNVHSILLSGFNAGRTLNFTQNFTFTFQKPINSSIKIKISTNEFARNTAYQRSSLFHINEFTITPNMIKKIGDDYVFSYPVSQIIKIRGKLGYVTHTVTLSDIKQAVQKNKSLKKYLYIPFGKLCYGVCGDTKNVLSYFTSKQLIQNNLFYNNYSDVFVLASQLTHFVHNFMTYDIKYVSQENVSYQQIFNLKRGVCYHYAKLLTGMLRSLGVPARMVYGFAKSSENSTIWQPHAWVQVYFLNQWVPFDPTYDEVGYVDSYHLFIDDNQLYSKVTYLSDDHFDYKDEKYFNEISVNKTEIKPKIRLSLRFVSKDVSSRENVAVITITNLENYYVYDHFQLFYPPSFNTKWKKFYVYLKPHETKTGFVVLKSNDHSSLYNYILTVPLLIMDTWDNEANASFIVSSSGKKVNVSRYERNFSSCKKSFNVHCFAKSSVEVLSLRSNASYLFCNFTSSGCPFISNLTLKYSFFNRGKKVEGKEVENVILGFNTFFNRSFNLSFLNSRSSTIKTEVIFENYSKTFLTHVTLENYSVNRKKDCIVFSGNHLNFTLLPDGRSERNMLRVCSSYFKKKKIYLHNENVSFKVMILSRDDSKIVNETLNIKLSFIEKIVNFFKYLYYFFI